MLHNYIQILVAKQTSAGLAVILDRATFVQSQHSRLIPFLGIFITRLLPYSVGKRFSFDYGITILDQVHFALLEKVSGELNYEGCPLQKYYSSISIATENIRANE